MLHSQTTFQRSLDLGQDDEFLCGINTSDGGYLACGSSTVPFGGTAVKLNSNGAVTWAKTVGGTKISDAVQTSWGGYYLAGVNTVSSNLNFYLCKLDGNGTLLWSHTYGKTSEADELHSMVRTPDGGVIMSGYGDTINGAGFRPIAYVVKTDSNGTVQWEKYIGGGTGGEEFYMAKPVSNGGYLCAGYTGSYGSSVGTESYVVRLDANGNIIRTNVFGHNNRFDRIYDFVEFPGNSFYFTGDAAYTSTTDNLFLAKTDTSGNFLWQKNYEEYHGGLSLVKTSDNNLLIGGYYISQALGLYNDSYLFKTDTSGTISWAREIGAAGVDDKMYNVIETPDAGFFMTGSNYGATAGRGSWFVKTDANGSSGCRDSAVTIPVTLLPIASTTGGNAAPAYYGSSFVVGQLTANYTPITFCSGPTDVPQFQISGYGFLVFPNPVRDELKIVADENSEVSIVDMEGRVVLQKKISAGENMIDVSGLAEGVYEIVKVKVNVKRDENGVEVRKLVISR
jgi:hypothetical protein